MNHISNIIYMIHFPVGGNGILIFLDFWPRMPRVNVAHVIGLARPNDTLRQVTFCTPGRWEKGRLPRKSMEIFYLGWFQLQTCACHTGSREKKIVETTNQIEFKYFTCLFTSSFVISNFPNMWCETDLIHQKCDNFETAMISCVLGTDMIGITNKCQPWHFHHRWFDAHKTGCVRMAGGSTPQFEIDKTCLKPPTRIYLHNRRKFGS